MRKSNRFGESGAENSKRIVCAREWRFVITALKIESSSAFAASDLIKPSTAASGSLLNDGYRPVWVSAYTPKVYD